MGRKKTSNKAEENANVHENTNAGAELVSEKAFLSADKVDLRDESKNATLDRVDSQQEINVCRSKSSSKKTAKTRGFPVRKSSRIQSAALVAANQELHRITKEVIASECDDEDEPADETEPVFIDKNLEEKAEYPLWVSKEHQEILDTLKSKTTKGIPGGTSSVGEVTYKSLYIHSQKKIEALVGEKHQLNEKIEALVEEKHQLSKKLEHALGKIEVYEKGNHVPSNVLEKWNGVIFCPSLTKDTEAAGKLLSEAICGAFRAMDTDLEGIPSAKRKKSANETKN